MALLISNHQLETDKSECVHYCLNYSSLYHENSFYDTLANSPLLVG